MKCALFEGIEGEALEEMLRCLGAKRVAMERGQTVFAQGGAARQFGVVLSGAVQVRQTDYFGNQTILAQMGEGEIFGEAFVLAGMERYPVEVACQARGEALLLGAEPLRAACPRACASHARLTQNMIAVLAGKNVRLMTKARILSRRTTREKLLAYFSQLARETGSRRLRLPFSRQELADYLCVDRSAMTVELMRLRDEGVVRVEGREVALGAPEGEEGG